MQFSLNRIPQIDYAGWLDEDYWGRIFKNRNPWRCIEWLRFLKARSVTSRIYLDNAATSWPKRPEVIEAVLHYISDCGATAGRGAYRSSIEATRWMNEARQNLSRLVGSGDAASIAFCSSGTHALNAALWGLIREGQHVIATQIEHNSVLRPLHQIARTRGASVDFARSDASGMACLQHAAELVRPETRWIVVGHASNVTGAVQPLDSWSELANRCGAKLIVDASQTLGYLPMDVRSCDISVLASAGHKGLGGLAGTGFLYVKPELQAEFLPLMSGGTGSHSELVDVPPTWPEVVEVGNHNLPGIVSMAVAAATLIRQAEHSPVTWQTEWRPQMERLIAGLAANPGIRLVGYPSKVDSHPDGENPAADHRLEDTDYNRVPLVSFVVDGWDVHDVGMVLDSHFGIEVRTGLHCAALIHECIGSQRTGGTIRISPGHSTSDSDIETTLSALRQIFSAAGV